MRKRARIDDNQNEVVKALRSIGCMVQSLATIGNGCADLLVLSPFTSRMHLLEVKDGRRPPSERRLTKDELRFGEFWDVSVVLSVDEALSAVGVGQQKGMR